MVLLIFLMLSNICNMSQTGSWPKTWSSEEKMSSFGKWESDKWYLGLLDIIITIFFSCTGTLQLWQCMLRLFYLVVFQQYLSCWSSLVQCSCWVFVAESWKSEFCQILEFSLSLLYHLWFHLWEWKYASEKWLKTDASLSENRYQPMRSKWE